MTKTTESLETINDLSMVRGGDQCTADVFNGARTGTRVGGAFGPWGRLIGGVVGGGVGYLTSSGCQDRGERLIHGPRSVEERGRVGTLPKPA